MAQQQVQEQRQEQRLQQIVTAQQLLVAQLVELPLTQMAERVETELHDNPALEKDSEDLGDYNAVDNPDYGSDADIQDDFETQREREERNDALDAALESIGRDDDELPIYHGEPSMVEDHENAIYGTSISFYDLLSQQMSELSLSVHERSIMEYLIGSLDSDGLLRKDIETIAEELTIYQNVDTTKDEVEGVLLQLQQFDPAGIGARSLQECLLLQIDRRNENPNADRLLTKQMREVIAHHFEDFTKRRWDRLRSTLALTIDQSGTLEHELRRLNPKPGASTGEIMGHSTQQITPDFIVDTQDDGTVTFSLNNGDLPRLQVSQSFADLLKDYQQNRDGLSRQMKEALLYTRQKVDAAQGFIEAVKIRNRTLTLTMQAIIQLQHRFFEDGDEASIRPMVLKDIADKTGLDLSTISRVSRSKYALTRWGIFPLKFFFSDGITTENGEEISSREIKSALREFIEGEDKRHPLSDDDLSDALKVKGYPIARRTVAKYRDQLGFPIARLRKK